MLETFYDNHPSLFDAIRIVTNFYHILIHVLIFSYMHLWIKKNIQKVEDLIKKKGEGAKKLVEDVNKKIKKYQL